MTGFCVLLSDTLVSWRSKKLTVVAQSIVEAEYWAMSAGNCELIWLLNLLKDLNITALKPIELRSDNKFALSLSKNPVFHDRTKHVEMDILFIREKVTSGLLAPVYVPTT